MTQSNIFVNIIGEFKKKGFDDASKATTGLGKNFDKLGKKLAAAFSIAAITKFSKQSIQAFAQAEREAAQLRATLEAINLGFASPVLDRYIDKLELATGMSGQKLTSAFVSLSQATNDVTTAQNLLNLSLDIAAATGKDLTTVAGALQRGYKGELTALARLRVGYTTAELKTKSFEDVVADLERRFSGSSAAAADNFAGKLARLAAAGDQAKEAFGAGFVTGLEEANVSIEDLQRSVVKLGEGLGDLAASFTKLADNVITAVEKIRNNPATQALLDLFDFLTRAAGFVVTGELVPSARSADATRAGQERRKAEVSARAELRQRNALIKAEGKITTLKTKQLKETSKLEKENQALKRAGTVFDMENIQIVAAMQGRITEDQRLRLTALLALNNGNAEAADKLSRALLATQAPALANLGILVTASDNATTVIAKIIDAQTKLFLLNSGIANIPKAKNPFEDWRDVMTAILSDIARVSAAINSIPKYNPTGPNYVDPGTSTGNSTQVPGGPPIVDGGTAWNLLAKEHTDAILESTASSAITDAVVDELTKRTTMATLASNAAFTGLAEFKAKEYGDVIVQVVVEGNVTTESDLVDAITDALYQNQKTGKGLLFSSTAI